MAQRYFELEDPCCIGIFYYFILEVYPSSHSPTLSKPSLIYFKCVCVCVSVVVKDPSSNQISIFGSVNLYIIYICICINYIISYSKHWRCWITNLRPDCLKLSQDDHFFLSQNEVKRRIKKGLECNPVIPERCYNRLL